MESDQVNRQSDSINIGIHNKNEDNNNINLNNLNKEIDEDKN